LLAGAMTAGIRSVTNSESQALTSRFLAALSYGVLTAAAWGQLPDRPGRELTASVCGNCHSTDVLAAHRQSRDEWTQTIFKMIDLGATGTQEQFNTILQYVAENFGPAAAMVNVNQASAKELESGLGILAKEAEAIVKYRKENGAFKTVDGLRKVPDLDFKKIEAVKDRLTF
jgi:competence ComEA-like helix-hairpin-helix protein